MTFDRRLHHAARELRELPIETPPFGDLRTGTARSRHGRSPALSSVLASMLFVVGGLLAVSNAVTLTSPDDAAPSIDDVGWGDRSAGETGSSQSAATEHDRVGRDVGDAGDGREDSDLGDGVAGDVVAGDVDNGAQALTAREEIALIMASLARSSAAPAGSAAGDPLRRPSGAI